jgi:hypothetical protein
VLSISSIRSFTSPIRNPMRSNKIVQPVHRRMLLEQKLGTTPKAMKEVFGGIPRSRIALVTGMHSPWASRLVGELRHEVIVAHARNVRLIESGAQRNTRFPVFTKTAGSNNGLSC